MPDFRHSAAFAGRCPQSRDPTTCHGYRQVCRIALAELVPAVILRGVMGHAVGEEGELTGLTGLEEGLQSRSLVRHDSRLRDAGQNDG